MVELDVTNNEMSLPGCLSAASYYQNSWDTVLAYYSRPHRSAVPEHRDLQGHSGRARKAGLHATAERTGLLHQSALVLLRPRNNTYASGCIINLPPFLDLNLCENVLNFVIDCFQVDIVLIIDRRTHCLAAPTRIRPDTPREVGRRGALGAGVQDKAAAALLELVFRQAPDLSARPFRCLRSRCTRSVSATPLSALTYGDTTQGEGLILSQVAPTQESSAECRALEYWSAKYVAKSAICGVVHVVEVDEFHHQIKLLAPGPLASKDFILGSLKMLK